MTLISFRNLNYYSLFFLFTFSGFYLTKILAISPIYFSILISSVLFMLNLFLFKKLIFKKELVVIPCLLLLYFSLSQIFLKPNISTFIAVVTSLISLVLGGMMIEAINLKNAVTISKSFLRFTVLILFIECIYRLSHPIFISEELGVNYIKHEESLFYAFKLNSIMYLDSNFVAIYALVSLFFYRYLKYKGVFKNNYIYILLILLVFLTFSRAAILSMVIFLIIENLNGYKLNFLKGLLALLLFLSASISAYFYFLNDPSFMSKFDIYQDALTFLNKSDLLNILIGVGFGNTVSKIGIGAHNFFLTYLIESGIIGLTLELILILVLLKSTHYVSWILVLSFLFSAMSMSGHALPFLYLSILFIRKIELSSAFYNIKS